MEQSRSLRGQKLIIASHNQGKVREIADLLAPFDLDVISAAALDLPEPEETGQSYIENAELKALAAARTAQLPALSDDSGLSVNALGGAPGIYSARWAGPDKDFDHAMKRVADALLLSGSHDRGAEFVCALTLAWPDGHKISFEGRVAGTIIWPARGDKGFGYDPIFIPNGHDITFGEMAPDKKHAMSHRAVAFSKLVHHLETDEA
ncbi:MAG: RdgB/HAM1 family non-canonical purine NTP pyrophosphatase [Candidatus Puniceispirillaceae bacterium]